MHWLFKLFLAVSRIWSPYFKKQQEQLKKYELVLKTERKKTKEANAQTERLKSLHLAEQAKDLKRAKANSTSLSNTVVNKNTKLKKWQCSYRLLEQEIADLHSERLERSSTGSRKNGFEANPIRVHPHSPPQPTTEEEDDEGDLGDTNTTFLLSHRLFAIEQSHGLINMRSS